MTSMFICSGFSSIKSRWFHLSSSIKFLCHSNQIFKYSLHIQSLLSSVLILDQYRSSTHTDQCNYLCQSSLQQPDFRYRPCPGITKNPYLPPAPGSKSFSAKNPSWQKYAFIINYDDMNRTYFSIYWLNKCIWIFLSCTHEDTGCHQIWKKEKENTMITEKCS